MDEMKKAADVTAQNENEELRTVSRPQKSSSISGNTAMKAVFGIIMILIYVGMGVLLFINFFQWNGDWAWLRYVGGVIFILYGVWRAIRQFAGINSQL